MIKKADLHLETRDYFLTKHRFDISKTSIDGVLITTPQPQELDKYYDSKEYLSHDDSNNSLFARLYRFARKLNIKSKFKLISKYDNGGKVLAAGGFTDTLTSAEVIQLYNYFKDTKGYVS